MTTALRSARLLSSPVPGTGASPTSFCLLWTLVGFPPGSSQMVADGRVYAQSHHPFLRLSESAPCVRHLRFQQELRFLRLLGASMLQVQRCVLPWSRCDLSARLLDLLLLQFCLISCCRRHNQDQMEEKLNFANVCKFTKSFCL